MRKITGSEELINGDQMTPGSGRIYMIIGLVGLIITGIAGHALFKGDELIKVYAPLVDAAMEIKLEATTAHLWFEEIVSGDRQDISEVWRHQDLAAWYANAMLEGGKNPEGTFISIDDTEARGKILNVLQSLKEFREITEKRLAAQELSGIGSEIDQRYDHLFQTLLQTADEVETQLQQVMEKDLTRFRASQLTLIVITLLLFVAIILSFRRFDNQRRKNVSRLKEANRALQRSEENLSITLNSIGDGVITTDIQGRVVRMNPIAEELTGFKLSAARNQPLENIFKMVNQKSRKKVENPVEKVLKKGTIVGLANHTVLISKNGTEFFIDDRATPIKDADGAVSGVVLIFRDITEKYVFEEKLRQSENRYRQLFEKSTDAIFIVEKSTGRYLNANAAAEKLTGRSLSDLKNLTTREVTPEGASRRLEAIGDKEDTIEHGEVVYIRPDGTKRIAALETVPLDSETIFGIAQDITEHKQIEEAQRENEYFFRQSQHIANIGSYRLDVASGTWVSSEVLDRIFGISAHYPHTVQGWLELIHADDRAMMGAYLQEEVLGRGKSFDKAYRIVRVSDGETRWVQGYGQLTYDTSGAIVSMIGTIQDITERMHEEEERDKLQAQLTQAQKMESVGRLAGGVAHDFNNMLSVIMGRTEMILEDTEPDQPLYTDLLEIKGAAQRSADVTRQLLAFARKQTIAPKVIDINEAIVNILKMLRRLIGEDIELLWHPGKELWPLKMDASQLDQILANLSVNARDAITGEGKLIIETSNVVIDRTYCDDHPGFSPGDFVQVTVSDNGCGMDQEILDNLFEPFYTTKDMDKGTGLGLATVYGIVKQNNGFINVYSEPNKGTSFKIYLPRYVVSGENILSRETAAAVPRGSESILLVEDEVAILKMTEQMLKRLGYTVLSANRPKKAIDIACEYNRDIHLLLTDVVMPEMNGQDLFKRLLSIYPKLKSLFMSGYSANVIAHHGILDEGVNYIQKPFSRQGLSIKLREMLDRTEG